MSEQENIFDDDFPENDVVPEPIVPDRHGCVTTWLILMLIANAVTALIYLFRLSKYDSHSQINPPTLGLLALGTSLNVYFAIKLLQYKKNAFYGFIITGIITYFINDSLGISSVMCIIGLLGVVILYGILQIKKDGLSAWSYLK